MGPSPSVKTLFLCIFVLPPFLLATLIGRKLYQERVFGSLLRGAVTGVLYIPLGYYFGNLLNENADDPSYANLIETIQFSWRHSENYAIAGAVAGLGYWLIRFSPFLGALVRFLRNEPKSDASEK